jgi:hypothetical protein
MPQPLVTEFLTGNTAMNGSSQTIDCVQLLHERFPHVREISLQLLMQNEVFRELCEEYEVCHHTAERLALSGSSEGMLKEYAALRLRLEGELLKYMSQHESDAAR